MFRFLQPENPLSQLDHMVRTTIGTWLPFQQARSEVFIKGTFAKLKAQQAHILLLGYEIRKSSWPKKSWAGPTVGRLPAVSPKFAFPLILLCVTSHFGLINTDAINNLLLQSPLKTQSTTLSMRLVILKTSQQLDNLAHHSSDYPKHCLQELKYCERHLGS